MCQNIGVPLYSVLNSRHWKHVRIRTWTLGSAPPITAQLTGFQSTARAAPFSKCGFICYVSTAEIQLTALFTSSLNRSRRARHELKESDKNYEAHGMFLYENRLHTRTEIDCRKSQLNSGSQFPPYCIPPHTMAFELEWYTWRITLGGVKAYAEWWSGWYSLLVFPRGF